MSHGMTKRRQCVVWHEYHCLWPGLPQLCDRMAVRRMARVLLPLACVNSSLLSYGCTSYGASMIFFGLGNLIFAIVWLYIIWRKYYCIWPALTHLCYHMAVRHMARALLPLVWVTSSLPSMTVRRMARVLLPLA